MNGDEASYGSRRPLGGLIARRLRRILGGRRVATVALDHDEAKRLARSGDPGDRRRVAENPDALPELLFYLARDVDSGVRMAVARHAATPRQADLLLAVDPDSGVRGIVAEKIAREVRHHGDPAAAQLWDTTLQVLEALARDDMPRIRRLIAGAAHDSAALPAALAAGLGHDRDADVAVTALGYPGRIADEALVEIVIDAPEQRVIGAVAGRPAIGAKVADAVVAHGDTPAVTLLLRNRSAEIASDTLDRVVDRAAAVEQWHEPLVERPRLSDAAAVRLASFIAEQLVKVLQQRPDLDAETSAAISAVVKERHEEPVETVEIELVDTEGPVMRARRMAAEGALGEEVIIEALPRDAAFATAALAIKAQLPPVVVHKILTSHSAKGLTALAWKAGFTMRLALALQLRHARLPPKARLNAGPGGGFPLGPEQMEWQIEFFRSLVG